MSNACDESSTSPYAPRQSQVDETTPLIIQARTPSSTKEPISDLQLTVLYLIQACEAITSLMIYPFVNQLVRSTGIVGDDEKRTGYYAGVIESLFFWAEGATVLLWQVASDKFGRRPVLLLAPLGLGLSMIGFGLSESFLGLVITRTLQGIFNGNVGVTKTALAEISDPSNRAEIMAGVQVAWSIGVCLAPFIGGFFSDPAEHWPSLFGQIEFWHQHPYLLPCLVSGILCLLTFALATFGLKESHPRFITRRSSSLEEESFSPNHIDPAKKYNLFSRDVVLVLVVSGFFAVCCMAVRALQPLIWSTSIENGGLGLDAFAIGNVNSTFGLPNAILQIFVLGKVIRVLGPRNGLLICLGLAFVALLLYPAQIAFAQEAGYIDVRVWTIIALQLCCTAFFSLGFGSILMYGVEVSPSPAYTGIIQGLLQTTSVFMRGVAPALASSLFAYSTDFNVMGGSFVYLVLGGINIVGFLVTFLLP